MNEVVNMFFMNRKSIYACINDSLDLHKVFVDHLPKTKKESLDFLIIFIKTN